MYFVLSCAAFIILANKKIKILNNNHRSKRGFIIKPNFHSNNNPGVNLDPTGRFDHTGRFVRL